MARAWKIVRVLMWVPLLLTAIALLPRAYEAARLFAFRADPATVMSYRLRDLDAPTVKKGIEDALAADDPELATSILDLARARSIPVAPELVARVEAASTFSISRSAREAFMGAVTGRAETPTAFGAAVAADLTVVGDLRDLVIEGGKYPDQDNLTVALAGTGLILTAATFSSAGAALPAKAGVSALKAAKRMRRLSRPLQAQLVRLTARAVDGQALKAVAKRAARFDFSGISGDIRRTVRPAAIREIRASGEAISGIAGRQGYRATLQTLERAESTADLRRLERVSGHYGKAYRGSLFLSRGSKLVLRVGEFLWGVAGLLLALAGWLLTAAWLSAKWSYRAVRLSLWPVFAVIRYRRRRLAQNENAAPQGRVSDLV